MCCASTPCSRTVNAASWSVRGETSCGWRWQRAPGDARVDAALLLPAIRGALPAADPRTRATIDAVRTDLLRDGYVYRFRQDSRPLADTEGAFVLCGFLLALATEQQGERVSAARLLSATGQRADRRVCSRRSTTSTSANSAATCRRPLCTHCCSSPRTH